MKTIQQFPSWFSKQKTSGKVAIGCAGLFLLCCLCSVPYSIMNPSTPTPQAQNTLAAQADLPSTEVLAEILPTATPEPTNTPLPPTATPDPNLLQPGTYLVGADIKPGIYRGEAGTDLFDSCYWGRLKDLSGSLDGLLANDNSIGQFYVDVLATDYALETRCEIVLIDSLPASTGEFPLTIAAGTYLVGRDIQPGTYKGQAGTDISASCYWARLSNVAGGFDSILANDNAVGQYYVQVAASDFALSTKCDMERVGD